VADSSIRLWSIALQLTDAAIAGEAQRVEAGVMGNAAHIFRYYIMAQTPQVS